MPHVPGVRVHAEAASPEQRPEHGAVQHGPPALPAANRNAEPAATDTTVPAGEGPRTRPALGVALEK